MKSKFPLHAILAIAATAALCVHVAHAGGAKPIPADPPKPAPVVTTTSSEAEAAAQAAAIAAAAAEAQAQAQQSQEATSEAQAAATNEGVDQALTLTQSYRRAAASAYAGAVMPTAECHGAQGLGVQLLTFGVSANRSVRDQECAKEQLAREFEAAGQFAAANRMRCSIKAVRAAIGDRDECLAILNELHAARRPDGTGNDYVTWQELRERERRQADRQGGGK